MFFCISLGFVIAWAPYAIVSFLFIFYKGSRYMAPEGFVFPALFAKSSHVYNPFIYFYFNKTFQLEFGQLLALWPRLGGHRVDVHVTSDRDVPHPIQIQLQERDAGRKKNSPLSWDRSKSKSKSKSKSRSESRSKSKGRVTHAGAAFPRGRPVYTCWASKSKNSQFALDSHPASKASSPASI